MNIPEEALDAAIEAILEPGNPSNKHIREISHYRQQVQAVLEAALPYIRKQISEEILDRCLKQGVYSVDDLIYRNGMEYAAFIVEKGTTK